MEETALLHLPEGMRLDQIQITEQGLLIQVRATSPTSCCPLCFEVSSSIHCHYSRTLRDVPCAGRQVQLRADAQIHVEHAACRLPHLRVEPFVRPVQLSALHDEDDTQQRGERQQQDEGAMRSQHGSPVSSSTTDATPDRGSHTLTVSPTRGT